MEGWNILGGVSGKEVCHKLKDMLVIVFAMFTNAYQWMEIAMFAKHY